MTDSEVDDHSVSFTSSFTLCDKIGNSTSLGFEFFYFAFRCCYTTLY